MSALLFLLALAQLPSFDVATIKKSPEKPLDTTYYITADDDRPGQISYRNMSLESLLATAFRMKEYQVEGPSWIREDEYDVLAKAPVGSSHADRLLMLQRLLAERLELRYYLEKKSLSAYVLEKGKTLTLEAAKGEGKYQSSFSFSGKLSAKFATTTNLVDMLSQILRGPVVDQTGLTGEYDIDLDWQSDAEHLPNDMLAVALQRKTGLVLKKHKAPLDVLVVEHVVKTPAAN